MNFTIWVFQTSALWPGLACQWPTPPGTVAGAHPSAPTLPYLSGYAPARRASSTVGLGPCRPTTASGPSPTPDVWRRLKGNQAPLSPPFSPLLQLHSKSVVRQPFPMSESKPPPQLQPPSRWAPTFGHHHPPSSTPPHSPSHPRAIGLTEAHRWPPERACRRTDRTQCSLSTRHYGKLPVPLLARWLTLLTMMLSPKTSPCLGLSSAGDGRGTAPPRVWPPCGDYGWCARRAALAGQATWAMAGLHAQAHLALCPVARVGLPRH
jgi:hypothetical protein